MDSDGSVNSFYGNGCLVKIVFSKDNVDSFSYDFYNLVFFYGGNVCCIGNVVEGGLFD